MALEQVRSLLKKDTNGSSLHQQLCAIIGKLVEEKPPDALVTLETLSRYLKESGFNGARAPDSSESIVLDPKTDVEKEQWCSTILKLTETPMETSAIKTLCSIDNFQENQAMFKWAGVGLGQQVSYQIHLSLRALAASTPGLTKLRFWGKILGIENDYFIAEGVVDGTGTADGEVEARGTGANTFCYFVSTGTSAPWTQLGLVRPEHIVAARKVKHIMTGNLEADVLTMPFFPGKEKHFLRAQIARISSASCLAVAGYLQADDEGGSDKVTEAPDFEFPEELTTQDKWVHSHVFIHKNGCTKWADPDSIEDEDLRKKVEQDREDEPPRGPLQEIAKDVPGLEDGISKDWIIKQTGDKGKYADKTYVCTVVKSLRWPGAITVAQGKIFANLYIGYGFKKCDHSNEALAAEKMTAKAFPFTSGNEKNSCAPAEIMDEPEDHEEQPEPNPQEDDAQSDQAEEDKPQEGE